MKRITGLIGIFFLSVVLLACSTSAYNKLDDTLESLLSSKQYEVRTSFLIKRLNGSVSARRTVTVIRDNTNYSISNQTISYHFTTYLVGKEEQYKAYIKTSNQGHYEYVPYTQEPNRFLNTINFNIDALTSSMFNYENAVYYLKSEYYSSIFDYPIETFTATFEDGDLMFIIELPELGFIEHRFKDIGNAELNLPSLGGSLKHEPREPWHEIPENVEPYLSVDHRFSPNDHVLSFEIEEPGEYLIWVESELFLNCSRFYFDGELESMLQISHGPGYGFLIKVPLYPGTTYYLNIHEYSSLYQGPFYLFIHQIEE